MYKYILRSIHVCICICIGRMTYYRLTNIHIHIAIIYYVQGPRTVYIIMYLYKYIVRGT